MSLTVGKYVEICNGAGVCPLKTYEKAQVREFLDTTRGHEDQEQKFQKRIEELTQKTGRR